MKVGIRVRCTTCKCIKQPHGRSVPLGVIYCDRTCPGYDEDPKPGCLWPGETQADFGFTVCGEAVEER